MDTQPHDDTPQQAPTTVRYLGLDWIRELSREVADSAALTALADSHRIGVTQIVTDGPEGTVIYHLQVGDGRAEFGAGPADPQDVVMEQSWETAVGVATGELNAHEAFMTGRIKLRGDQELLLASQPVFGALDAVFGAVRPRTDYS
jgi:putative sterol carrier protein